MPYADYLRDATDEQRALYAYMSDLSERCWCAGWIDGNEAACWEAVMHGGTRYGLGLITSDEAAELKRLSDKAGGWWHWPGGSRRPQFVSLDEWRSIYAEKWQREGGK